MPQTRVDPEGARRLLRAYWRKNIMVMLACLAVWAIAGLGCGVLWAEPLNQFFLPGTGYPLGFWFAQQGSIIVFVILVLVYSLVMNRLDRQHLEELRGLEAADRGDSA